MLSEHLKKHHCQNQEFKYYESPPTPKHHKNVFKIDCPAPAPPPLYNVGFGAEGVACWSPHFQSFLCSHRARNILTMIPELMF